MIDFKMLTFFGRAAKESKAHGHEFFHGILQILTSFFSIEFNHPLSSPHPETKVSLFLFVNAIACSCPGKIRAIFILTKKSHSRRRNHYTEQCHIRPLGK